MSNDNWGSGTPLQSDRYTEVSSQSWFSRIGRAFVSIPIGILLFLVSFVVLFWNEGRAVHTARGLSEGKATVVNIEPGSANSANEKKLVHLAGEAMPQGILKDEVFGVSAKAIRLDRLVQMYQWKESSQSSTRKKLGGGTETVTTYSYDRGWSEKPIDSTRFKQPDGHQNPAKWPIESWTGQAPSVTVGAFKLSTSLIGQIGGREALPVDKSVIDAVPEGIRASLKVDGSRLYRGKDPTHPEVGDMTVAFEQVKPQEVSILARQSGDSLGAFTTQTGTTIERLQKGNVSADEMFQVAETENRGLTWLARLAGFVLMCVGIMMVLSPLTVLADVVPFIGYIVGFGTLFVALATSTVLSLVTIALGWIFYRPLVGISILVLAALALYAFRRLGSSRRRAPLPASPVSQ
jgi:hypothetical protein